MNSAYFCYNSGNFCHQKGGEGCQDHFRDHVHAVVDNAVGQANSPGDRLSTRAAPQPGKPSWVKNHTAQPENST